MYQAFKLVRIYFCFTCVALILSLFVSIPLILALILVSQAWITSIALISINLMCISSAKHLEAKVSMCIFSVLALIVLILIASLVAFSLDVLRVWRDFVNTEDAITYLRGIRFRIGS